MDPHEYVLFSSGSRIDVFSGATNPLSRAIHESSPAPMQPPSSECEQPTTPKWLPRMEVSTKEASRRVGPHLGGNHSGFQRFLVSETHGACGFATKIDSDRQVIGRACRFTAFTAHTILGSWRSSNCAGFVGGHLSHLEDICWACADTLSATNTSVVNLHHVEDLAT